jgi:hypothetical protein
MNIPAPSSVRWRGIAAACLIVLVLATAFVSVRHTLIVLKRQSAVGAPASTWTNDPQTLALRAEAALIAKPDSPPVQRIVRLASQSLRGQALNARALRVLGYVTVTKPNDSHARKLVELAEKTSRRDLGAQVWLVEQAVVENNIPAALRHYDVALSTNVSAQDLLFPILANALGADAVRREFVGYIKKDRPWLEPFAGYAIWHNPNPENLVAAINSAGGLPRAGVYRRLESQLLSKLVEKQLYDTATSYYRTLPGSSPQVLTSVAFDKVTTNQNFAPIAWEFVAGAGINAALNDANELQLSALSGERGVAARKLLFLPPGQYQFDADARVVTLGEGASSSWEFRCVRDRQAALVWRREVSAKDASGDAGASISVPSGCAAQFLDLNIVGGTGQAGAELVIGHITLKKVSTQ